MAGYMENITPCYCRKNSRLRIERNVIHCVSCGVFVTGGDEEDTIINWNDHCRHHWLYKDWLRLKLKHEPGEKIYPGTAIDDPVFEPYYPLPEVPSDPSQDGIYFD
jgi:hypothetical protein